MLEEKTETVYPTDPAQYVLKAEIGRGAFATVYLAQCLSTDEDVAIKILDLDELDTAWEEIKKEIITMGMLNHDNVVRCLCSFVVEREIWLVMPLLAEGSCSDIMKKNFPSGYDDESLIASLLKFALMGIQYLHGHGSIHRDVKAGNILLSKDGSVQIADFGVAGSLIEAGDRKKSRRTFVGTPCWMAPEVMEQSHGYDYAADIWSFGITALELAFGRPPYAQYQPMKVMLLTLQEPPPTTAVYEDNPKKMSKSFREMVAKCLQKDPSKRPTAKKLLEHKFFKQAKKEDYIVEKLLSVIPRPKWLTQDGPVERQSLNDPSSVSAWEFDEFEFSKLKEQHSHSLGGALHGVSEETDFGADKETTQHGRFEVHHGTDTASSTEREEVRKGRFVISEEKE